MIENDFLKELTDMEVDDIFLVAMDLIESMDNTYSCNALESAEYEVSGSWSCRVSSFYSEILCRDLECSVNIPNPTIDKYALYYAIEKANNSDSEEMRHHRIIMLGVMKAAWRDLI